MKTTSIDKLGEVYNALTNPGSTSHTSESLAALIKEVLRAEQPDLKSGSYNIYNFVSKDKNRPEVNGVFYDGEYRVASDLFKLIAEKGEWETALQGKIIGRDGSEIEGRYPKWRSILPRDIEGKMSGYAPHAIDKKALSERIAEYRADYKAKYGKSKNWDTAWRFEIDGVRFSCVHLWAFTQAGIDTLYIHEKEKNHAAIIRTDRFIGVIMPVR